MSQKNQAENGNVILSRYSIKLRKPLENKEPSLTKQSFKDEADVNNILQKYTESGVLPSSLQGDPLYGDFAEVPSFQESQNIVIKAEMQFQGLSAQVRKRFNNEPEEFLAFVNDPKNANEMVSLGLAFKKDEIIPVVAEDIPNTSKNKQSKATKDTELS